MNMAEMQVTSSFEQTFRICSHVSVSEASFVNPMMLLMSVAMMTISMSGRI